MITRISRRHLPHISRRRVLLHTLPPRLASHDSHPSLVVPAWLNSVRLHHPNNVLLSAAQTPGDGSASGPADAGGVSGGGGEEDGGNGGGKKKDDEDAVTEETKETGKEKGKGKDLVKEKETEKEKEKEKIKQENEGEKATTAKGSWTSRRGGQRYQIGSTLHTDTRVTIVQPPDEYPQVLALPLAKRPIFPGYFKAVVVRNKDVMAAIDEAMRKGQPYVGAFLLKDENSEADVIETIDQVHPVGVFATIQAAFPTAPLVRTSFTRSDEKSPEPESESLTLILHPHRRIKITDILPPLAERMDAAKREDLPIVENAPTEPTVPVEVETSQDTTTTTPNQLPSNTNLTEGQEGVSDLLTDKTETEPSPTSPGSSDFIYATRFLQKFDVSVVNVVNYDPPLSPIPANVDDKELQTQKAVASQILETLKLMTDLSPMLRDQISTFSSTMGALDTFSDPVRLTNFVCAICAGEALELQSILESQDLSEKLTASLTLIKKELMNLQLQAKISKDVEFTIQKRQKEYYLAEQFRAIKKELGMETDGKEKLVKKFRDKAETLKMPEHIKTVFEEEITKLEGLEPAASEFNVTRNYLDWITQIPWGKHSKESLDIRKAVKVLDEDHYGLKEVKDRILEFLAVGKLRGKVDGKILCFVGPPGVGKTSIGKSIARALNRQFFRFSVGGLTDVAEIKGHRRTYVGAMPGKIIQALKKVQTENPLILIDEVDKIGRGYNGDPSSALLEMLDPEQNASFLDHYLDVPVDLSKVLFVCTANVLDTIPAPLLDRMEVMEVSGYVADEKMAIATQYLGPQAKESTGLQNASVDLTKEALEVLIRYYARESGVRRLKQMIEKIYRKAAFKIVTQLDEAEDEKSAVKELSEEEQIEPETIVLTERAEKAFETEAEATTTEETAEKVESTTIEGETTDTTTVEQKPLEIPDTIKVSITADDLLDYVGPPVYQKDRIFANRCPPGVSTGLGYLGNGSGSVMPIEVSSTPGKGDVQLTGKLGEVIKESAHIALTFLKSHAYALGLVEESDHDIMKNRSIHLHMPEGSIGKEGPSAGTAILSAFTSLFSGHGLPSDLAMTGELTLAGQVLPVGGLKEKILAAHRAGIKTIIAPAANQPDIEYNVPASVKEGITIIYATDVRDVFNVAFKDTPLIEKIKNLKLAEKEVVQDRQRTEKKD